MSPLAPRLPSPDSAESADASSSERPPSLRARRRLGAWTSGRWYSTWVTSKPFFLERMARVSIQGKGQLAPNWRA